VNKIRSWEVDGWEKTEGGKQLKTVAEFCVRGGGGGGWGKF